ncbi:MAG: hypothetical protein EOO73_35415 [Myxococcales bacterium]|nr:MAG: hypothetical protein EOO73_35415 [Myxococcales bacterium]
MNATQATTMHAAAATPLAPPAGGAEMRMLVMMVQTQLVQGEAAKTDINLSQDQLKDLREQVREAMEQAREAEEESGFFGAIGDVMGGDIATIAQVVAIAAAAVVTCGTAAAVLATIAIACTLASRYGEELGIPPKVAMGLGIAAAVASVASGNVGGATGAVSAASSGGSAAASAGAAVGSAASGAATATAVTSGGLAATATAASKVTWLTATARDVGYVANVVSPAASGAGAVAKGVGAYHHSEALEYDADAKQAQSRQTLENMDIDTALGIFQRSVDRQLSVATQTQQLVEANQRSHHLIISGVA